MSKVSAGNWDFDMRRFFLLFSLSWILLSCAESDDGPISIYPDNFPVGGYGYVLHAQLDSGNRFHIQGDTLELSLDSMWTFGNCFLKEIELYQVYADSVLTLSVKLALGNTGTTDCPQPLFRPDTVLRIPFSESWEHVREIRVEGNAHNEFFKESPDTASSASLTLKDSIWVRRGTFLAESVSVYLDSAFDDPYRLPRRTSNDSAGVLLRVDSVLVDSFAYRLMKSVCAEIHDSCETVPDTLWLSLWSATDTNLVAVRKVCKDDSLVFCLSSNWKNDSTALSDSVYDFLDTTWYSTFFYAERIPKCSSLDRGDFSGRVASGRYFVTSHTLFVPAADESSCGPAANSEWLFLNLDSGEEILDSVFADTLLQAWKKASVGLDEEKND